MTMLRALTIRRCFTFALLAGVAGLAGLAPANALDCAALRDTNVPFEIKLDRKIAFAGQEPAQAQGHLQVLRHEVGSTTYQFFSTDAWFRAHYAVNGFPDAFFTSKEGTSIALAYTPAPTNAMFADEKPLAFHVTLTRHDGQIVAEQDHEITFFDHREITLAGCSFAVVRAVRKILGTVNDQRSESETEFFYAPALRTSLYLKTTVPDGPVQTYTGLDISLEFKPVE